ncbi:MAG TPA: hypothetical protein VM166_15525 [Gemmatimonadaceae bacterium]|nr:hypothetical protein [Gemmatimonadaceae bacterium]
MNIGRGVSTIAPIVLVAASALSAQVPCLWDHERPVAPPGHTSCDPRPRTAQQTPANANVRTPASGPSHDLVFSVVELRGDVAVETPDGRTVIGGGINGAPLPLGARLLTGPTGYFKATLPDGTFFTIGPNGLLVLDEFVWDAGTNFQKVVLTHVKGVLRWVTGRVSDPPGDRDSRIKMSVGYTSIRGTDFECLANSDGSGYVKLFAGEIVFSPYDSDTDVLLHPGEMIQFDEKGNITKATFDP